MLACCRSESSAHEETEESSTLRDAISYLTTALCLARKRRDAETFTELRSEREAGDADAPLEGESAARDFLSLSELEDRALLLLSYCNLCLRNHVSALRHATFLMSKPGVGDKVLELARCYAAEARFSMCDLAGIDLALFADESMTCLSASSRLVNAAAVQATRGNLSAAAALYTKALELSPSDVNAIRGLVYVFLRQGNVKDALQLGRRGFST